MGIRRVVDPAKLIATIYSEGRQFPRGGKPSTAKSYDLPADGYGKPDPAEQAVQSHESGHGPKYDNDVARNWLRGYGETKAMHPHFDSGPSGNRYKR